MLSEETLLVCRRAQQAADLEGVSAGTERTGFPRYPGWTLEVLNPGSQGQVTERRRSLKERCCHEMAQGSDKPIHVQTNASILSYLIFYIYYLIQNILF